MANVVEKTQCPKCLDSGKDNLAIYDDGSSYCFGCKTSNKPATYGGFIDGHIREIKSRGITEETCKFFDYRIGKKNGKYVHIANYKNEKGEVVAQKLRNAKEKKFSMTGDGSNCPLYGQWLWSPNPKLFITIVEGEIDALTIAQVQGYQYPVVSIPKGAGDARKSVSANLKYLLGFKYVILAFDSDEAGREASNACSGLFEPGGVRIASWPLKDANEMLLAGRAKEIKECIFLAKEYVPDSVVEPNDIIDLVLVRPEKGIDYPWKTLTDITYGLQSGEIYVIVAATGVGKTEFVKDIIFHFIDKHEFKIGLFSFEQNPDNTVRRLVGAKLGIKLHLPGEKWDENAIRTEASKLQDKLYLYNRAGKCDLKDIFNTIRYLARFRGVKLFIVDNLKAIGVSNDWETAEELMNTLKTLCKDLGITVYLLSHVAKDKYSMQTYVSTSPKNRDEYESQTAEDVDALIQKPGLSWESGRMPNISNVEGSGIVTQLADYVFALARNSISEDYNESRIMIVKALKTRLDSSKTGKKFKLFYGSQGKLEEQAQYQTYSKHSEGGF